MSCVPALRWNHAHCDVSHLFMMCNCGNFGQSFNPTSSPNHLFKSVPLCNHPPVRGFAKGASPPKSPLSKAPQDPSHTMSATFSHLLSQNKGATTVQHQRVNWRNLKINQSHQNGTPSPSSAFKWTWVTRMAPGTLWSKYHPVSD